MSSPPDNTTVSKITPISPRPPKLSLDDSVQFLKGVGPKRAELLNKLGLATVHDCLYFLPRNYTRHSKAQSIANLIEGETVTVSATVINLGLNYSGRRRSIFEMVIQDDTGLMHIKWFRFNKSHLQKRFQIGQQATLSGQVKLDSRSHRHFTMIHPEILDEDMATDNADEKTFIPIYPATEGLNPKSIRHIMSNLIKAYLTEIEEILPPAVIVRNKLIERRQAFLEAHVPPPDSCEEELKASRSKALCRLIFEELFLTQLGLALKRKHSNDTTRGRSFKTRGTLIRKLFEYLPFKLTGAQKRVLKEIMEDLEKKQPMQRMVHGDVGAGKTLIALISMLTAADNGAHSALMAPTELLAEQHFLKISPLVKPLGIEPLLVTGAMSKTKKKELSEKLNSTAGQIIVGTHALIQKDISIPNLGLVVIDEQHRFGVLQREALGKKGNDPDVLIMTATPIPRSLAMTLYGDMDVSILDESPPGRKPITTRLFKSHQAELAYSHLNEQILAKRQAYVVCPLIEDSPHMDLKTVTDVQEKIISLYPHICSALLHGRLTKEERQDIMNKFKEGEIQLLIATTLIEVGIDVPNATLMLIEHAERFGLAQLHQMRGRVGRGTHSSECLLISSASLTKEGKARLKAMVDHQDGFAIAEADLKIRGPGDFMGTRQSGLPDLRIADLVRDQLILIQARKEAVQLVDQDPFLKKPEHDRLKQAVTKLFAKRMNLAGIL